MIMERRRTMHAAPSLFFGYSGIRTVPSAIKQVFTAIAPVTVFPFSVSIEPVYVTCTVSPTDILHPLYSKHRLIYRAKIPSLYPIGFFNSTLGAKPI